MFELANVNFILALGTVALQVITIGILFVLWQKDNYAQLTHLVGRYGFVIAWVIVLFSVLAALFYEMVLGLEPCSLCWWQRVFLFPQVILVGLAAWKNDKYMADYSIALSIFGLGVALYQHALQILPSGALPCPSENISCAQRFVFEFGYVTFPLMAATVFAFLIVTMFFVRSSRT